MSLHLAVQIVNVELKVTMLYVHAYKVLLELLLPAVLNVLLVLNVLWTKHV